MTVRDEQVVNKKYIAFKYDDTAKLILANKDNTLAMKELLKEILDIDLEIVKIDLNEFPRAYVNGKRKVLDILVSADNLTADVEININPNKSTYMRNYVYLSTIISNSFTNKEKYSTKRNFYLINLDFGEYKTKEELLIKPFNSSKLLKEYYLQSNTQEKYLDNFKIVKINMEEMRKLYYTNEQEKILDNRLLVAGSLTKEELDEFATKSDDKVVNMVKDNVEEFDVHELAKIVFAEDDSEKLWESEKEEFYEDGKEAGLEQGHAEATITIAKNMLAKGTDVNFISEVTGLSIDEINALKNN